MKTPPPGRGRAITEMIMTMKKDEGERWKLGTRWRNGANERQTDKGRVMGRVGAKEAENGWGGREEWDCISSKKSVKTATQDESSQWNSWNLILITSKLSSRPAHNVHLAHRENMCVVKTMWAKVKPYLKSVLFKACQVQKQVAGHVRMSVSFHNKNQSSAAILAGVYNN